MGSTPPLRTVRGFTLIELLVVVAVIAILAAIALPNFLEAQTRAKVSRVKADMRTIATALEIYTLDYNAPPPDFDGLGFTLGEGEWRTYSALTTPVAYLTAAPTDIFAADRHEGRAPGPYEFFEYWGLNPTMFPASFVSWQEHGVKWFVFSFAPDRDDDYLPTSLDDSLFDRMYDPTNGTISNGDIGRSNLGVYPQ